MLSSGFESQLLHAVDTSVFIETSSIELIFEILLIYMGDSNGAISSTKITKPS
jgi:hypothetical protein